MTPEQILAGSLTKSVDHIAWSIRESNGTDIAAALKSIDRLGHTDLSSSLLHLLVVAGMDRHLLTDILGLLSTPLALQTGG